MTGPALWSGRSGLRRAGVQRLRGMRVQELAEEIWMPSPRTTYSSRPAAEGNRAPNFAKEYPCSKAIAPASRNESQTAAPATSPAAPSNEKMPTPTMAPTPMNAA